MTKADYGSDLGRIYGLGAWVLRRFNPRPSNPSLASPEVQAQSRSSPSASVQSCGGCVDGFCAEKAGLRSS